MNVARRNLSKFVLSTNSRPHRVCNSFCEEVIVDYDLYDFLGSELEKGYNFLQFIL